MKLEERIEEIETEIAIDEELSCGMISAGAYDSYYEEICRLEEQLGKLKRYEGSLPVDDEFPFPV